MKSKGNRSRVLVSAHPAGEGSRCRYQMAYDTQYFCLRRICVSQELSKEKGKKKKKREEKKGKENERKERERKEKKTKETKEKIGKGIVIQLQREWNLQQRE